MMNGDNSAIVLASGKSSRMGVGPGVARIRRRAADRPLGALAEKFV